MRNSLPATLKNESQALRLRRGVFFFTLQDRRKGAAHFHKSASRTFFTSFGCGGLSGMVPLGPPLGMGPRKGYGPCLKKYPVRPSRARPQKEAQRVPYRIRKQKSATESYGKRLARVAAGWRPPRKIKIKNGRRTEATIWVVWPGQVCGYFGDFSGESPPPGPEDSGMATPGHSTSRGAQWKPRASSRDQGALPRRKPKKNLFFWGGLPFTHPHFIADRPYSDQQEGDEHRNRSRWAKFGSGLTLVTIVSRLP
jgi:hypothetical protein